MAECKMCSRYPDCEGCCHKGTFEPQKPTQKEIDMQLFTHIGTITKILQAKGLITAKQYDQAYAETEKEIARKFGRVISHD